MSSSVGSSFTVTYKGLSKVLRTNVNISPNGDATGIDTSKAPWVSLWDTGANRTVITQKVVDDLNLKPVSKGKAATPQGTYEAFIYYIDLYLPNHVVFPKLLVMQGQPAGCDVLVGMDVIGNGDFAVSNYQGQTVFSYRFPSCTRLDFVENSYIKPVAFRSSPDEPAKNSRCPCGSGLKYKQCCGKDKFQKKSS